MRKGLDMKVTLTAILLFAVPVFAQSAATFPAAAHARETASDYVLGPGDQMNIWVMGIDEQQARQVSVDPNGYIDLPMAGRVRAEGLSLAALHEVLNEKLKLYFKNPQCSITITEFRSQPVSVLGSVKEAGVRQLQGGRKLLEVLSLAGGLAPDAGQSILVTREPSSGPLQLDGATSDARTGTTTGEISVAALMSGRRSDLNIEIKARDIISVTRARMVYVMGEVGKPGAFILNEQTSMPVLQALSLAGGVSRTASPANTRILRSVPGSSERHEEALNLRKVLDGKSEDLALRPDDILFIPNSLSKNASLRAIEAGIQVGTGLLIWK
jgi:polysaccharide export outer membrane protein